ncbi:MAG: DUF86 domain-containing protein [Elusimicrobia bacterium]|nr:DUF86 domain-containing protein [Elusimicrobiota bacterium]
MKGQGIPLEFFIKDADSQAVAERNIQVAVEALVDIGNHLICEKALDRPESNAEVFLILGAGGLLPQDLAGKLARWARFRNILVHGYAEIDLGLEYRAVMEDLGDLRLGAAALAAHLKDKLC